VASVPLNAVRALHAGWSCAEADLSPLGTGHINDTYLVNAPAGNFVLQRINQAVFVDPGRVMVNLTRIHAHVEARYPGLIPELLATIADSTAHVDDAGNWWRLWRFIDGARSLDTTEDPEIARAAGAAFGTFQALLEDLPGPMLEPTIEGFLELERYLAEFDDVLQRATHEDADPGHLRFVEQHRWLADSYPRGTNVVHGDCKLNNLLFAAHAPEVVAVLDLDTVMPGHWAWDFGDLSRSVLMGPGDRMSLFESLVAGYVETSNVQPAVAELVNAPVYVAFMLGVRFLADHLAGDRYFKIDRRGENLDRAAAQFELVRQLESERPMMERAAEKGLEC
jgi:Ser/Thr protein kinase RdoA (MazF antagonist)